MTKEKWWQQANGMTHKYVGRINKHLHGKLCRLLVTWKGSHAKHNVLVEFDHELKVIVPMRTLRRISSITKKG